MSRRPRRDGARNARGRIARAVLLVLAGAVLFALGVALGRATLEHPEPRERTEVRTLQPGTVAPPRRTVTVTATSQG